MATRKKPKPKRRNPSAAGIARKLLARARALSKAFHGTAGEVVELSPKERKPLPRYVTLVGRVEEMSYQPDAGSKRSGSLWRHKSGERAPWEPASSRKPLLVVNPLTKKPALVPAGSPMKLTKRGLSG